MPTKQIEHDAEDAQYSQVDGQAEDITDLQNDIDDQMNTLFSEFGGDPLDTEFRIKVQRVIPGQGKREHCFECVPSELPIVERVRHEYGPGSYEVWIYKNGKLHKRRPFNIAQMNRAYKPPTMNDSPGSDLVNVVKTMVDENRRQMQEFQQMFVNRQPAQIGGGLGATDLMGLMLQMKEFLAPAGNQQNSFEAFLKGIETVKDLELGGGEKGIADVVIKMAEKFGPGLLAVSQAAARPVPRIPEANVNAVPGSEPGNSRPNPAPETPRQPTQDEVNAMQLQFQQQLNMLVFQAKSDNEPATYAEMILDNVPEENIRQLVDRPDWLQYLAQFNPEVQQHGEWFKQLRDCLLEGLTGPGEGNHNRRNDSREPGLSDEIPPEGNPSENT